MKNKIDYVISSNAQAFGGSQKEYVQTGTMVGTKNYFFFFPNTALGGEGPHKRQTVTKTAYSLGGLPVEEFIKNKLEQDHLSSDEFEKFALNMAEYDKERSWVAQAFPFSDIKQIKMQINFFFGTITINKTDQKIKGWEPVFLKVGKQKKDVKEFYSTNPIIR
jgi:hypothetical protein